MDDYDLMAGVIDFLGKSIPKQPSIDDMASQAGLSTSQLRRKFKQYVGTSPKVFLQFLTQFSAGRLLRAGATVEDASLTVGYSGTSRLHDACIRIEAATPGEIRSGGAALEISAGFAMSLMGEVMIAHTERGICKLCFLTDCTTREKEWDDLKRLWPNAEIQRSDVSAMSWARKIFAFKPPASEEIPLFVRGSDFQLKVWEALICIPPQAHTTYGELARLIGKDGASRAVGTAVGRNNISYLIPCHRVIRATGEIGNYRWGAARKQLLLAWESSLGTE